MLLRWGVRVRPATRDDRTPVGIDLGLGAAAVVVAACVAAAIPTVDAGWRFGVVAFAVSVFAAVTADPLAVAGVALLGWLVVNGFLVDRFGQLAWHGSADLLQIMVLALVSALGIAVGQASRQIRATQSRLQVQSECRALMDEMDEKEKRDA